MAKILVIDDDEIMNELMVAMLTKDGYEVHRAFDGNQGIALFKAQQFDLVVTDIIMPDKEGLETIREIRATGRPVPIIAVSGGGKARPEGYLAVAQSFGADYAFEKPLDKEPFLAAVRECLDS